MAVPVVPLTTAAVSEESSSCQHSNLELLLCAPMAVTFSLDCGIIACATANNAGRRRYCECMEAFDDEFDPSRTCFESQITAWEPGARSVWIVKNDVELMQECIASYSDALSCTQLLYFTAQ